MKGRAVTREQKEFHDKLCQTVGCIACRIDGRINNYCIPHHIDGRTKPNAHWMVLPLCAGHHQDGTGAPGLIAVHPWKRSFEARYGNQYDLLEMCKKIIQDGAA
jgi:hypothetical protein